MTVQQYDHTGQYDESDPYVTQYPESGPNAGQYSDNDPHAGRYPREYEPHGNPEDDEKPYEQPELYPESSVPPTRASKDPDYYVSLEPCARGSSCNLSHPKCMIRLIGNGYQQDIELSLDSKMDFLFYKIFRSLEDEGLEGVSLQGLPKKNCFMDCLSALCASINAFCSTKPIRCQTFPQHCCCCRSSLVCTKGSFDLSRRSTASATHSLGRGYSFRKHWLSSRTPFNCRRPCRMAKICQGPKKNDCVLIKISPSLPEVERKNCKKRSTGVGTDDFPELEVLLQGGNKRRRRCKKKRRLCVCPHCCSGGRIRIDKVRSRGPQDVQTVEENMRPRGGKWPEPESWSDAKLSKSLDGMSEGELESLLGRLEKGDDRLSFNQPQRRSGVHIVLVESGANDLKPSEFSGSCLVVPTKVDVGTNPSEVCEPRGSVNCSDPLKVYFVQDRFQNGQSSTSGTERLSENTRQLSDSEIALLLKVWHLAKKILEKETSVSLAEESHSAQFEPRGASQKSLGDDSLQPIFCRSNLWLSTSDVTSTIVSSSPSRRLRKRANFVARLKKHFKTKHSPMQPSKAQPLVMNQDRSNEEFKKLRIYLETDPKDNPSGFVPIELTKKNKSVHLNTLIR